MQQYNTAVNWWQGWNQSPWPPQMVPEDYVEVPEVCILWLYLPRGCKSAWLGPLVSNPAKPHTERKEGVMKAIRLAKEYVKNEGYDLLLGCTDHPSLQRYYAQSGLFPASQNSVEFVGSVWQ